MKLFIKTIITLLFTAIAVTACSSDGHNPYGDPDSQRERSKGAQDEMRRDTTRY